MIPKSKANFRILLLSLAAPGERNAAKFLSRAIYFLRLALRPGAADPAHYTWENFGRAVYLDLPQRTFTIS